MSRPRVRTGLDRVAAADPEALSWVRGRRVGLLAHPASVDARLRHALPVLREAGAQVVALFGPEHGLSGEAQDMQGVIGRVEGDATPIYSLYGDDVASLSPQEDWLKGLEAVVIDLQDVGSRYYTYVWTAALMLRAAAACGVQTVVLDRPNPLGGEVVEGAPQREGFRSFVGLYDLPVRHGFTLGEICSRVQREEALDPKALHVVRMQNWHRALDFEATGLPWVLPSPNMPSLDTAFVYPGGCLLEGTNLSEGRGTTRPFEIWGAPFVDGAALAREIQAPGVTLRPLTFLPTFQKHAGQSCGGVQVHVHDRQALRSFALYVRFLSFVARRQTGFELRKTAYEFVDDRPALDLLYGGPELRENLDSDAAVSDLLREQELGAEAFRAARVDSLLY